MAKYIVSNGVHIAQDYAPETYGRLTAIGPSFLLPWGRMNKHHSYQVWLCECGAVAVVRRSSVVGGNTSSCGCLNAEMRLARNTKHGKTNTPTHTAWISMLARCYNPNTKSYADYGGRGIRVCDEWRVTKGEGFMAFLAHIGERPSRNHSVDRLNNEGNYTAGNVKWSTKKEQANNKRSSRLITYGEECLTLAQWSDRLGLLPDTIASRLDRAGWSLERALTTPVRKQTLSH